MSLLLIDKIIIAVLFFFFLSGWVRGFLKSLIGPVSFVCCFISAIIFYDLNRNLLVSVLIATAGTLAMAITLNVMLILAMTTVNKEFRGKTFFVSRILGSFINIFWQGNIFFMILIIFSMLPIKNEKFENFQGQISISRIVAYYQEKIVNPDNRIKAVVSSLETLRDPDQLKMITNTPEFSTFYKDPKVQKFLNDPQVIDALAAQDSLKLIQNPSLRELITDDNAMYSLTRVARMVYRKKLQDLGGESPKKTGQ